MSTKLDPYTEEGDEPLAYRALSTGAVASLILGLLSVITIPTAMNSLSACVAVSVLPLVGLLLGLRSLMKIRQLPDQLVGGQMALVGTVLSAVFLVAGLGLGTYVYATEVPEGYQRVTFKQLKPDDREMRRGEIVPSDVLKYNGQQVFIKGYMRPPSQRIQIDRFLLVRDNQECCFGAQAPAYFDQIQVHLMEPLRTNYSTGLFRLGGTLHIDPDAMRRGPGHAIFSLEANHLQ